jgi:regulator of protease activity HflC (stomatin/prohibitin superfamily)
MTNALLCGFGVIVLVIFTLLISAIRIVPEYKRLVVFRLGRVTPKPRGPGLVFLIPFIDRPVSVDLREQVREVPHQTAITKEAMNRQMSAERIRRAVVTESTGAREAAINVADGEKQSSILKAEGQKQAVILQAEGERLAQQLKAEGFAIALTKIFESAKGVDQNTMTLQYLDALKRIGEGASTKYIFPLEFTSLAEKILGSDKK